MFGKGSFGAGGGGPGKGIGKRSFRSRPLVEHSLSTEVPEAAVGLIIGSKGSNIKELQAIPGIEYVELRNGKVDIGGTVQAVHDVQMKIQAKLNSFLTSSGKNKTAQLQVDVEGPFDALCFVPASTRHLLADLSGFRVGRDYFVVSPATAVDGLTARLSMLGKSSQSSEGHSIHAPMNLEEMQANFKDFLDDVSDITLDKVVDVQMRFGVMAFHMLSEAAHEQHTLQHFRALMPHKDFKMQFSCQLKFSMPEIEAMLVREGFEFIENHCCTVVHMVSLAAGEGYVVVFVEPSQGKEGDPRMDAAKRRELERIAQCRSFAEVLEILPGASKAVIKKAYFRKSLMVHPDKNAYHGSTEAMKVLGSALESLESGRIARLQPPLFDVGGAAKELPQITEFMNAKVHHLQEDVVRMEGRLGYRAAVTSKGETNKPAAREFLERAWEQGSIIAGGTLQADANYSIDSVRFKEKTCYSNGNLILEVDIVKQKALENAGHFQTYPELVLRSPSLEEAVAKVQANPSDLVAQSRALELYMELLAGTQTLASTLSPYP